MRDRWGIWDLIDERWVAWEGETSWASDDLDEFVWPHVQHSGRAIRYRGDECTVCDSVAIWRGAHGLIWCDEHKPTICECTKI